MNITLNHAEIEIALTNYVSQMGVDLSGKNIAIALTAGRMGKGYSASVGIENAGGVSASDNAPANIETTPTVEPETVDDVPATEKKVPAPAKAKKAPAKSKETAKATPPDVPAPVAETPEEVTDDGGEFGTDETAEVAPLFGS